MLQKAAGAGIELLPREPPIQPEEMFDWIWAIVQAVSHIVWMGCDFLGWSTVWVRNAIKKKELQRLNHQFRTPTHLAVTFTEEQHIRLKDVTRFLELTMSAGVRRVSLYDPWGKCLRMRAQLEKALMNEEVEFFAEEEFPDLKALSFAVQLLGPAAGRQTVVNSIKELLSSEEPLTAQQLDNILLTRGIIEPEMLIKVGALPTMAGYPPLSLRVTEIVSLRSLPTSRSTFHSALLDYSRRDIRLGK
ncbi:unnamed protein product, partial [Mesorhabditis belari]|uniref:ditrans,polycis-polyprenyl diphosphate synthase [(2E,6E)-farnesyldiphosphate specific] n=1 Tax=Mesorhabditis belari TaxID=2138241 RepID=A0AAF3F0L7_9BILA